MRMVALALVLCWQAFGQAKSADGFAAWFTGFQAALVKNDAKTLAAGARWPMQWENGPTREIKAEADLAARLNFYFTPEIRKILAGRKPEPSGADTYAITWKARGNEYSIYFKRQKDRWALDGLSEGPP